MRKFSEFHTDKTAAHSRTRQAQGTRQRTSSPLPHTHTHSRTHRHARNTKPPLADTRTGTQGTAQPNTEQDDTQEDETNKDEGDTKQPRKKRQMMTQGKRTETQRHTVKQLEFLRCPAVVWSSGRAARVLVPGGFCRVRSTSQMVNHINDSIGGSCLCRPPRRWSRHGRRPPSIPSIRLPPRVQRPSETTPRRPRAKSEGPKWSSC